MSYGYSVQRVHAGDWLYSTSPGGFGDALSGIHVPGPKVRFEEGSRRVLEVTEMPDPIQLPHFRIIRTLDKHGKVVETKEPFDLNDDPVHGDLCEGLNCALATGIIVRVDEQTMRSRYPHLLDSASNDRVHQRETVAPDMRVLVAQFEERKNAERDAEVEALSKLHGADKHAAGAAK